MNQQGANGGETGNGQNPLQGLGGVINNLFAQINGGVGRPNAQTAPPQAPTQTPNTGDSNRNTTPAPNRPSTRPVNVQSRPAPIPQPQPPRAQPARPAQPRTRAQPQEETRNTQAQLEQGHRIQSRNRRLNHVESLDINHINLLFKRGSFSENTDSSERVSLPTQKLTQISHLKKTNDGISENFTRTRRNAATLAAQYLRSVNGALHDLHSEMDWAASALENEGRENNAEFRRMQTGKVRNVGEMVRKMKEVLEGLQWMERLDFGTAPERFYLQGEAETEGHSENVTLERNANNRNNGSNNDNNAVNRPNEAPVTTNITTNTNNTTSNNNNETENNVTTAQAPESTEALEERTRNHYRNLLQSGINMNATTRDIHQEATGQQINLEDEGEDNKGSYINLISLNCTPIDILGMINNNMTFLDRIAPKLKEDYQTIKIKHGNNEEEIRYEMLVEPHVEIFERVMSENGEEWFKEGFEWGEVIERVAVKHFGRFNEVLLEERETGQGMVRVL